MGFADVEFDGCDIHIKSQIRSKRKENEVVGIRYAPHTQMQACVCACDVKIPHTTIHKIIQQIYQYIAYSAVLLLCSIFV